MNAVVTFEDSVKERLKSIVAATVQEFEKNDLPKLVKAELTEQYKKAIAAEFAKPEWQATWSNAGQEASPMLRQMIIEAAPAVLAQMIGGAIQQTMYNLQSQIQRY